MDELFPSLRGSVFIDERFSENRYIYIYISEFRSLEITIEWKDAKRNVKVHQGCNSSLQWWEGGTREREEKLENVKASSYPVFIKGGREGNENFVEQSTRLASRVFPVTSRWCYVTRRNVVALQSVSIHRSRVELSGPV